MITPPTTTYTCIDSIQGSGKSSLAFETMRDATDKKYIYVTPYLKEIERAIKAMPKLDLYTPPDNSGAKLPLFHQAVTNGRHIAITHELLRQFNLESIAKLKDEGYNLIIDETVDTVRSYGKTTNKQDEEADKKSSDMLIEDVEFLMSLGVIETGESGRLKWSDTKPIANGSTHSALKNDCDTGRLYHVPSGDDKANLMFWMYPPEVLASFTTVTILTYRFKGSLMSSYLVSLGIIPIMKTIDKDHNLVPWSLELEHAAIKPLASLINVLDNDLYNDIGLSKYSLSSSWYRKRDNNERKAVGKKVYSVFQNIFKVTKDQAMWSCVKAFADDVSPKSYKGSFVTCNIRASNDYRDRTALAYLRDIYPVMTVNNFYHNTLGTKPDADEYALAELLQWIFRSAIRDGKPINLYLPSRRMRNLLKSWMDCEFDHEEDLK